ncbi:MAG: DcaP family trimeric outer membrane transporter [Novosphingobium sp.]
MHEGRNKRLGMLLAATALVLPGMAMAETPREAELAARLERLEAEMAQLRADLQAAKAQGTQAAMTADAAATRSEQVAAQVATLEAKPAPASSDGFKAGPTTIRLGGYIKLIAANTRYSDGEVATNSLGRDFYLPQAIPTGNGPSSRVQDFTAKQSRFWLNFATDVGGHSVKGYLETDFQTSPGTQGSQRTTNGYNLALRRAYMQFDRWTIGQDWTTFQYTGALPESTDYLGGAEGTVFVRQPLVRYSAPLGDGMTLHISAENPESGTATLGTATLIENGDDSMPDFAARLAYVGAPGELSLAGLARQVRVDNAGVADSVAGWGVSGAGKLYLDDDKSSDLRFMATYGHNIGRYVGLNFAPDAVFDPATGKLGSVRTFAALAALRIALAPRLRANLMGSFQRVSYAGSLSRLGLAGYNRQAWSGAANLFYSPMKNVDLGIEYRHGERELVSGAQGALDRVEFAAKYSF